LFPPNFEVLFYLITKIGALCTVNYIKRHLQRKKKTVKDKRKSLTGLLKEEEKRQILEGGEKTPILTAPILQSFYNTSCYFIRKLLKLIRL
jgi:hypothetical protein